jgi:transposase
MLKIEEMIESSEVGFLPIIKYYAQKIRLVDIINSRVESKMEVKPGIIILAMVMDTLTGRSPLYRLEEYFENLDIEVLLGEGITASQLSDDNLSRGMDNIYENGASQIFSEIALEALKVFSIKDKYVRFDSTSRSVYGDYIIDEERDLPFKITYGHSKDHRPDLKQFMIELLCVDKSVPMFGKLKEGNSSDKTLNNEILTELSVRMSQQGIKEGAFVYIGDSALVTEKNLKTMGKNILFISRLPSTYTECHRVTKEAVEKDEWEKIGVIAQTEGTKKRPVASYKIYETEVNLYGTIYRAVVVHSTGHDRRKQKKIEKEIEKSLKQLGKKIEIECKKEYFCFKDADLALENLTKEETLYHKIEGIIEEKPLYKRGPLPKDGERKIKEMRYIIKGSITEKKQAIEQMIEESGCFVLISNTPKEGLLKHTGEEILRAYKEQYGIEQNFSFLKDPLIVNSIFLKKPERIEVLGLVLLLSLLIWRLIERSLRLYTETGKTLVGLNKKLTDKPTTFMMTTKFAGILILKIGHQTRRLNKPLSSAQSGYLEALGISANVFTTTGNYN